MKRRLRGAVLGTLLSAICLPTLLTNVISYAEDGVTFAGGNNSYNSGTFSNTNTEGWGITFNTSGGSGESRVVGAKVSIYYTTNEEVIAGAETLSGDALTTYLHNNITAFTGNVKTTYSAGNTVNHNSSFYVCDDASYLTYITGYVPYSDDGYWGSNIPTWIKQTEAGDIALGLNSVYLSGRPPALNSILNDSLYNTSVWKISPNQRWFVAGSNSTGGYSEDGTGNLPDATKETIVTCTEALVEYGGEVGIPSGAFTIWFVEPLVSADIELSDGSWQRVAITPAMMAYYADNASNLGLNLDGWSDTDSNGASIWESFIKVTSTDGLSGNPSFNSTDMGAMLKAVNNQSYGAYAVALKASEITTHDEVPEIPSIPVFQKDGNSIEYMGVSSSIPTATWSEITTVLKYAMNLTDSVPTSGLYSYCSNQVSSMKGYADYAIEVDGTYNDLYATRYKNLWNRICSYYANTTINLGATSASIPSRISSNQPTAVSAKFGDTTKNTGPFEVTGVLGSIGTNVTLNYQNASFYNLNSALGIVNTNATSTGSLGSKVLGSSLSVGDILKNPYEYSIVMETINVVGGDAYPEPPNIVIWDEKQGNVDSAFMEVSIDPNTWGTVLNTLKYARNDGGVNSLNMYYAEQARTHAAYLSTHSMTQYNAWQIQKSNVQQYLNYLTGLESKMKLGITEMNNILNGSLAKDYSLQEYGGSSYAYVNKNWYPGNTSFTVTYRVQNGTSGIARSDVFQAYGSINETIRNYTGVMSQVAGYGTWEDCYQSIMKSKYYDKYSSWTLGINNGSNYGVAGEIQFPNPGGNPFFYYNYNRSGTWPNFVDTPKWEFPDADMTAGASGDVTTSMLDVYGYWYLKAQIDTYNYIIDNYISAAKTDANNKIAELNGYITEYEGHVTGFNTNYESTMSNLMNNCFQSVFIVNGTRTSAGAVTNYVTQNIYGRSSNKAIAGMSKPYEYPSWVFSGSPQQVSYTDKATTKIYSAYKSNGDRYAIGSITNNCMLDEVNALMENNGDFNLNFKCRVVKAGDSATDVMTRSVIVQKASGTCSYKLTYNDVFKQPYSYGIIINSLDMDTTSTKIQEWQLTEYMEKDDLDDSSVWTGWGQGNTPSFTLTNTPTSTVIRRESGVAGKLSWLSMKVSGGNAPGLATDIIGSLGGSGLIATNLGGKSNPFTVGETSWSGGSYKDTGLYKVTHNWGGNAGTIEILTAEITSVSSVPTSNSASVVADTNKYQYNHANTSNSGDNGGTYLNIWKNNGSVGIKTIFPMMVSSYSTSTLGYNDYPLKIVSDATGNYHALNNNNGLGVHGYKPEWCHSNITHTLDSPFNVIITYRSNTTLKTTFSTDKEDTDGMQSDIDESLSPIPYLKAGQTFEGTIGNNTITIKGYANIGKDTDFIRANNMRFKTETEFVSYMNGILTAIKNNAKVEVVSTINGFNVDSTNQAVVNGDSFDVNLTEANSHVDNDAGVKFSDTVLSNPVPSTSVNSGSKKYEGAYFRPYGSSYNSYVNGPITATLATKTQLKYNELLNHGLGTTANWYYEYSEALGIAYYEATITFNDYTFTGTISRYESDAETETDYYVKNQYNSISNAWKSFGYGSYLMKSEGKNVGDPVNVVATAIDLTDVLAASPELAELLTKEDGTVISTLLGKQTPIHIRGSVYDNT